MNRKIKSYIKNCMCGYIIGDRGSGKTSLFALIADEGINDNIPVYSNYPIIGANAIPTVKRTKRDGSARLYLDKDWLYSTDLTDSIILIDEARTVWNARSYNDWTVQDEDFFNLIRHNNTQVWLASQVFDGVDLNCRRAVEYSFFVQRIRVLPLLTANFSSVEISRGVQLKVADKNSQVMMRGYAKGAQKVVWDIGELPCAYTHFYRKPYYNKFNSEYRIETKVIRDPVPWVNVDNPLSLSSVSDSSIV